MSDTAARSALERMNLREVGVAPLYSTLAHDLQRMAAVDPLVAQQQFMDVRRGELCEAYGFQASKQEKPFAFSNGIAIIPFTGSLINRFGASYGSYVTGYNFIRRQLALALGDDDVKGIIGDFHSNGGEVAGCFETSEAILAARGKKPLLAVVDSNCYSAAYLLATAFDKIICTPTGGVGSIGVLSVHMDISKAMSDFGVKMTFIHFGEHKVDGNPYEALPASVKADIQKSVNKSGENFVAVVAKNRNMDAAKVRDTQAQCFRAEDALALGLIDSIAPPNLAVQSFFDELTGSVSNPEQEDSMSAAENQPGAQSQADKDAAVAATNATALAAATEKAAADARVAERQRMAGITGSEEAKGRSTLANHLAMNTNMSVDDAKAVLKASAPEVEQTAATGGNPFAEAMNNGKQPQVGADGSGEGDGKPKSAAEKADAIMADFKAAGGLVPEAAAKQ